MHHLPTMYSGRLQRRYKRFLADIVLDDGREITAHCANSGAMTACALPGAPVLVSRSDNPKRKLPFTWELIHMGDAWVGVNTQRPNAVVADWIRAQRIDGLAGYDSLRREVPYGAEKRSRIDLLLGGGAGRPDCFVEIKNATMRVADVAAFPDAVTTRGQKHLLALMECASQGARAVLFFFVGRADCTGLRPADEVDPTYGRLLREAEQAGVEIMAHRARFEPNAVYWDGALPVIL